MGRIQFNESYVDAICGSTAHHSSHNHFPAPAVASAARRSHHLLAPSPAIAYALERYLRVPAGHISILEPRLDNPVALEADINFRRRGRGVQGQQQPKKQVRVHPESLQPRLHPGVLQAHAVEHPRVGRVQAR